MFHTRFIGAEAAGYIIYHSVSAAWIFVAGAGLAQARLIPTPRKL